MNREEEGEARRGVSEKKPLRWDDGTDEESGGGGGRRMEGGDCSPLLRRCSRAPSCATVTLRFFCLFKSFHNNNINNNNDHDNAKKIYINPSHVSQP